MMLQFKIDNKLVFELLSGVEIVLLRVYLKLNLSLEIKSDCAINLVYSTHCILEL
jgi:hypothetical protein